VSRADIRPRAHPSTRSGRWSASAASDSRLVRSDGKWSSALLHPGATSLDDFRTAFLQIKRGITMVSTAARKARHRKTTQAWYLGAAAPGTHRSWLSRYIGAWARWPSRSGSGRGATGQWHRRPEPRIVSSSGSTLRLVGSPGGASVRRNIVSSSSGTGPASTTSSGSTAAQERGGDGSGGRSPAPRRGKRTKKWARHHHEACGGSSSTTPRRHKVPPESSGRRADTRGSQATRPLGGPSRQIRPDGTTRPAVPEVAGSRRGRRWPVSHDDRDANSTTRRGVFDTSSDGRRGADRQRRKTSDSATPKLVTVPADCDCAAPMTPVRLSYRESSRVLPGVGFTHSDQRPTAPVEPQACGCCWHGAHRSSTPSSIKTPPPSRTTAIRLGSGHRTLKPVDADGDALNLHRRPSPEHGLVSVIPTELVYSMLPPSTVTAAADYSWSR